MFEPPNFTAHKKPPDGEYFARKPSVPPDVVKLNVSPEGSKSVVVLKLPVTYTFPEGSTATPLTSSSPDPPAILNAHKTFPRASYLATKASMFPLDPVNAAPYLVLKLPLKLPPTYTFVDVGSCETSFKVSLSLEFASFAHCQTGICAKKQLQKSNKSRIESSCLRIPSCYFYFGQKRQMG